MKMSRPANDPTQSKNDNYSHEPAVNPHGGHLGKRRFPLNSLPWMSVPLYLVALCPGPPPEM